MTRAWRKIHEIRSSVLFENATVMRLKDLVREILLEKAGVRVSFLQQKCRSLVYHFIFQCFLGVKSSRDGRKAGRLQKGHRLANKSKTW